MAADWEAVASTDLETGAPLAAEGPSPASFGQRMAAGFKSSPKSERNYYASQFGAENVRLSREDAVEIKDPKTGQWRAADPSGFDAGDIADMVGGVPEVLGGAVGGLVGGVTGFFGAGVGAIPGSIGGAAVGTAGGNAVRQAIGAMLPGQDVETLGQRAADVGIAGALGGVGEGVGRVAYTGVIKPAVQAVYRGALREGAPAAAEAAAIERSINRGAAPGAQAFQFTPGETTGGRALLMVEDAARNDFASADQFYRHAQANLGAMRDKALRVIDDVRAGARPASDMATGNNLGSMFNEITEGMQGALEERARREFAVLDTGAARRMQFEMPNLQNALQRVLADDVNSRGVPGAAAEGVQKLMDELPERFTPQDMHLYLKRLGRMGYGKGDKTFMERLGDDDRAKMARTLFRAMSQDVDMIADSAQPGHTMVKALRVAKDNFRAGLEEIDGWQNGLFAKVVGERGPESAARIVDSLYKLNPDELKSVMTVVGYRPEVANAVRANWIERAFTKSQERALSRAGTGEWFNARTFADALGNTQQLEALFGRTHREVLNDLITMQRAVGRMNSRAFIGESPSAGRTKMSRMLEMLPTPSQWPNLAKSILVPQKVARILLDPRSREELAVVANAKAPTQRVGAAITYLLGQEGADLFRQE